MVSKVELWEIVESTFLLLGFFSRRQEGSEGEWFEGPRTTEKPLLYGTVQRGKASSEIQISPIKIVSHKPAMCVYGHAPALCA